MPKPKDGPAVTTKPRSRPPRGRSPDRPADNPHPVPGPDRDAVAALRARERVIAAHPLNARVWAINAAVLELRARIRAIVDGGDDRPAVARAIKAAGLDDRGEFNSTAFDSAIHQLADLGRSLDKHIGLILGDLPAPPAHTAAVRGGAA